jgi:4-diphosphocytidyl-2-C-methyl-D-erythritol kinase
MFLQKHEMNGSDPGALERPLPGESNGLTAATFGNRISFRAMPRPIAVRAPAKLNLALSVGPPVPTPGGAMHPICSWMVTVNLFDDLLLTRLDPGSLSRYAILWHKDAKRRSDINWSISKDLAVRAHVALERHLRRDLPVQLRLDKRIPIGGGLGGGSSDAAAMLRGLNELFALGLSCEELASVGATIGSDVPFLVHGGSAIVEGFGDSILRHEPPPTVHAVIVFPAASCPTARVYGLFDELGHANLQSDRVMKVATNGLKAPDAPFNDLAAAAIRAAPALRDDLAAFAQLADRPAHVSGSGSSLFVICDHQAHAIALASAVEQKLNLPAVSVQTHQE